MPTLNDVLRDLKKLNYDIRKISLSGDLDKVEINYKDSQDLFLRNQIQTILNQLSEVHNNISYLFAPIQVAGRLHYNASSGHYETENGHEYRCGSDIEALVEDEWNDVPYWVQTRVEASNGQYYLVGYRDVPLDGLQVRIRKSF